MLEAWRWGSATALIVTGLPLYLFHNSRSQPQYRLIQAIDTDTNPPTEKKKKVNFSTLIKPQKAIISRDKGLLTRCIATTSSFTAIVCIIFKFYPSKDSPKDNVINFSVCSFLFHWNIIMIEMTLSGPQYFSSRNIANKWHLFLSCIPHWRVRFLKHNTNQTRKKALYQLLDYIIHGSLGLVTHKIVNSSHVDTTRLSIISKSIVANIYILSILPMIAGLITSLLSLVLGDRIAVRYCYDSPWKATSMEKFWKRWSIQVGEPLRDYVYIPLGGKYNYLVSSSASFGVNTLLHCYLFGLQSRGSTWDFVAYVKAFTVLSFGTFADMILKESKVDSKWMNVTRYVVMLSTLIGQTAVSLNELSFTKDMFQ